MPRPPSLKPFSLSARGAHSPESSAPCLNSSILLDYVGDGKQDVCTLSTTLRQKEKPLAVGGRYEVRALQERRALPSTASSENKGEGKVFMATEEGQFLSLEPALDHCSLSASEKHHFPSPPGPSCCRIPASCQLSPSCQLEWRMSAYVEGSTHAP